MRNQFFKNSHACHDIPAIIVACRVEVAVSLYSSGNGPFYATVVAARSNLQMLLRAEVGKSLRRFVDVVCQHLRAELDERIGISLKASAVPRLPRKRMLNINLDNSDAVKLAMLKITENVETVCFTTRNRKEVWDGQAVRWRMLCKFVGKARVT